MAAKCDPSFSDLDVFAAQLLPLPVQVSFQLLQVFVIVALARCRAGIMQVEGGVLVNPGSLYTFSSTRQTSKTYGVLDLNTLEFGVYTTTDEEVTLAEVEYEY